MTQETTWRSGWTAADPMDIKTGFTAKGEGEWVSGAIPGASYRDLGLAQNSGGLFDAQHIKFGDGVKGATDWQFHDADFQWFFVVKGEIKLLTEDGQDLSLGAGASAYHPPYWRHQIYSVSSDCEAYEVVGPAIYETVTGRDVPKPGAAAQFAHLKGVYTFDVPESYVRGDGPRSWAMYRDLGTSTPTDGRVHIHIIKLDEVKPSPKGGTGAHAHTMAQWFLPIRGWIDIAAEGQPDRRLRAGDFMMLQRGAAHNAFDASPDYMTLEFCVPADYETHPR
ncbi:cupin domain-containing protein [Gordonia paraffinivorans]|uniref:cupin domain-containing protein n=1 Tax=Gordonia paraffinivorans TaxID=175628 RepID=UPI001447E48C|nr:cupin domain-containing protein [Gordonia paraffinivorans]